MAFCESEVRANLTYGSLMGVEGLSQQEVFLRLPVKDIIVGEPGSSLILIDIGIAHKQLSLSVFENPPDCSAESSLDKISVVRYAADGEIVDRRSDVSSPVEAPAFSESRRRRAAPAVPATLFGVVKSERGCVYVWRGLCVSV
ncbi:Protein of unknown function- DUF538 [Striga hermonthica]|uniref:Uncharacterized protein n=1 Tax=Striga hermonthica TaxID=68872 RepID=A0A9N7N060_STRHE|nr:Protein of unknown function- DUF538 [Striga hermonthica]